MNKNSRGASFTTRREKERLIARKLSAARRFHGSLDRFLSSSLVVVGLMGMIYVLGPSFFPPTEIRNTQVVVPAAKVAALERSVPVQLDIPDIGLSTTLVELGKNTDGSLEVPASYDVAGWYKFSPTPGEIGPTVITGHVDNYLGPAVFFYLKDLQPGQRIAVTREDKSVVIFRVDRVALFDQEHFPTAEVYGDIDYPGLRLITCGGTFNVLSGQYSHNTVVYASRVET